MGAARAGRAADGPDGGGLRLCDSALQWQPADSIDRHGPTVTVTVQVQLELGGPRAATSDSESDGPSPVTDWAGVRVTDSDDHDSADASLGGNVSQRRSAGVLPQCGEAPGSPAGAARGQGGLSDWARSLFVRPGGGGVIRRSSIVATLEGKSLCITPFGLYPASLSGCGPAGLRKPKLFFLLVTTVPPDCADSERKQKCPHFLFFAGAFKTYP
jgi:hypothetical protein